MRILKIAPIYIPVSPSLKYGGIERVVLSLARSFLEKGHEVLIACAADSELSNTDGINYGRIVPTLDISEWNKPKFLQDPEAYERHIDKVVEHIENLRPDIVHDHTGNFVLSDSFNERIESSSILQETPIIVTPHEFLRFKKIRPKKRPNVIFTVLSEYQRQVFSQYIDIEAVINNGVFVDDFPFEAQKKPYLFSLGSIEEDKGQDLAARVAQETGLLLVMGGPIPHQSQRFYDLEIKPFVKRGLVKYVGTLNDSQKKLWYKDALASISPIRVGDCFSLVRVEPLACGTPVITLDTGSAREAIIHKKTGYVIPYNTNNEEEAVEMMKRAVHEVRMGSINPYDCRKDAEKRFNWRQISEKYINLYQRMRRCYRKSL